MIVDTAGLFPTGKGYLMECAAVPEEITRNGYVFWQFAFKTMVEGVEMIYTESIPIWLTGPVFKALQFKEVSTGRFDVDPPLALGRKFTCDIIHQDVKGTPRARMGNMVPIAAPKVDDTPAFLKGSDIPFGGENQVPI